MFAGVSPEVRSCDDFRDGVGHLTAEAAEAVGATLGRSYRAVE